MIVTFEKSGCRKQSILHTKLRQTLITIAGILFVLNPVLSLTHEHKAPHPNVLIVLADDQGWGDLTINGNSNLSTPNIDTLAQAGAAFDRFYVCPVCSPTRAEFLTGRYHPRGGVYSTSAGGERLDLDEKTIADAFKAAGYATAAFGKWHNGSQWPYHPNARGFDTFYGFCSGHWGHYFSPDLEHNGRLIKGNGYVTDDFTDQALRFIEQNYDQPFFCYLACNTPHSPMQVPDRFYKKFEDANLENRCHQPDKENIEHTRAALAMCENIDWNVGRLLKKLDELGIASNTIVVYFSDNGPNGWRWNGGMKGIKGSTDEGGVRSPLFIRWLSQIKPGMQIAPIAGAIDLLPTLSDLAGIPIAGASQLDGVSLKPLLLGETDIWPDRMLFHHWRDHTSVRTQRFKRDHTGALFDMENDPGQMRNVSAAYPDVADQFAKAAAEWRENVLGSDTEDKRPFPVGYLEAPVTLLPARDGMAHGSVQRSNRYPNCSFFTHWTSTHDSITWDIQVITSGLYEASVYYTCPAKDVGAAVQLRFGGPRVSAKIKEAHDPPMVGAEHDRVERIESYVKAFKRLQLGTVYLPEKRGLLSLSASHIPGRQVMDLRCVMLRLINP
jgi:arylsulfatase A-like enzyme